LRASEVADGKSEGYEHAYEMLLSYLYAIASSAAPDGSLRANTLGLSVTVGEVSFYLQGQGLDSDK